MNSKLGGAQRMSRSQEKMNVSYPEKESNHISFVVQPAPSRNGHCCWDADISTEQQLLQPTGSVETWLRWHKTA